MPARYRIWISFALALGVHALLSVLCARSTVRHDRAPSPSTPAENADKFEVEFIPDREKRASPAPTAETREAAHASSRTVDSRSARRETAPPSKEHAEAAERGDITAPPSSPRSAPFDFGLHDHSGELVREMIKAGMLKVPRGSTEGAPSTTGGVVEALEQHDAEIGMSRGGPVLAAIEEAARLPEAPVVGSATFDISIESSGSILVALSDANANYDAWAKLKDQIRALVRAKHVRIPPGAIGLRFAVRVTSREQYLDGSSPAARGTSVTASPGKIVETRDKIEIKELPNVTLMHRGKVCSAGLSVGLGGVALTGGCSPENMGAAATRVVQARILKEGRM